MLCALSISDSKLYIKFLTLDKSLEESTMPLYIEWENNPLVKIDPTIKLVESKEYCFPIKNKTHIKTTSIIIKYRVKDNYIYLSPVVSILLDPSTVSGKTVKSKKGKMGVLNQLAEKLYSLGLVVTAIHPENVCSTDQNEISGYIYTFEPDKDEYKWEKATFPFPKVIYNQISARRWESLKISENAKEIIVSKIGNRFFNSCFLDKYVSYNILNNNIGLDKFLLDVKMYTRDNLINMIEKHSVLYIKPISNSLGIGIWRLLDLKDGRYALQVKKSSKVVNYISKNIDKLVDFIDNKMGKRAYLIQEGVNLLKYEERIFDIRALTQKNSKGKWGLTGAGARVAAPKAYMTHIPNGGEIMNLDWILNSTISDKCKLDGLQYQLQEMATTIPETLEDELSMRLGEISMDIGINQNHNLLLIEINAKPMKFDEIDIQKKAVDKLTGYISYLSGSDEMPV